jgi:hypothetical protein
VQGGLVPEHCWGGGVLAVGVAVVQQADMAA